MMIRTPDDFRHVLIVDDDSTICAFICEALHSRGISSTASANRATALILAERLRPDFAIIDHSIPGDIPVSYFVGTLRSISSSTRIVLITGSDNPTALAQALAIQQYLEKPFSIHDLFALLKIARYE